ncbi:protein of unknown function Met10 [Methanosalsum zhilinae DSM 4017]|uniref:SAM-dependent methyltransferase TRM5/TYW2-type domain-containing protein n=1 Tax=Methanosalsum zhilinae (strain DSM 4017 / NBRC 107636 / OCM 62 / WeN5) TaxID=679901 RepID=F7XKU8_METZD|nr:hypothetical protein [Methanosalsum zhilinae]AEH61815.1 protein of unknown function Met10 [Methanosalsum zhilinae DSM 4017]
MKKMEQIIAETVSSDMAHLIPARFDVLGDIAVVQIPPDIGPYKRAIAEAIVENRRDINVVLNKITKLTGDSRTASFECLLGNRFTTDYREYGYVYRIDLANAFFNSRLSYERQRIQSQVKTDEMVVVPFSGVGPFAIPAAKKATVVAVDSNHRACRLLKYNSRINSVEDNLSIVHSDACSIRSMFSQDFDRAIVPAPYGMDRFLKIISDCIKKGGMIHFYTFKKEHQIPELIHTYHRSGLDVRFYRRCGNVAPGVSRWALDLIKT